MYQINSNSFDGRTEILQKATTRNTEIQKTNADESKHIPARDEAKKNLTSTCLTGRKTFPEKTRFSSFEIPETNLLFRGGHSKGRTNSHRSNEGQSLQGYRNTRHDNGESWIKKDPVECGYAIWRAAGVG